MLLYPNAKINIGLNIVNRLKSGFHQIESCFCPVSLYDIIEIKEFNRNHLSLSGGKIDGKKSNNIVNKAINVFNCNQKFKVHLHKNIPIGAGLGGGSSDGSIILKFLNKKLEKFSEKELLFEANKLGSDCPFFIENKTKYVSGTGNIFEDITLDLSQNKIIIINPEISINTSEAFQNISPSKPKYNLKEILENENIENWNNYIKNDFEEFAFSKIKILKKIKSNLKKLGAKYISLSGSGSCIYGIFNNKDISDYEIKFKNYIVDFIA
tara:strand:+ start:9103 stop:9903 length:801 start_codon:yes stop_codon:yes gene_type:complete